MVRGLKYKCYTERLALLQTTSLESRRIRGDLIQVFRIMNGFDDVTKMTFSNWTLVAATVYVDII